MFHMLRMQLNCQAWLLYVASEENISDWPSRGDLRRVIREIGAKDVRMVLPTLMQLSAPWAIVYRAMQQGLERE